jgi:hypothetical protein
MVPLPLSYNRFATDCAKEVISAAVSLEEGLSVSQPTKAIHSEVLKNPLGDFDEHLTLVDEMMQSLDTLIEDEGERKRCYDFLRSWTAIAPVASLSICKAPSWFVFSSIILCATFINQLVNNTIEVHKSVMTPVGGWLNEWRLTAHN